MTKNYYKSFLLSTILLLVFACSSCQVAIRCDYDYPFQDIEWEEITREEATEIWGTYNTVRIPKRRCTVKSDGTGSEQIWRNCRIIGSSYKDAEIMILLSTIDATIMPEEFPEDATFYTTKSNSSLVRIKTMPNNAELGENFHTEKIYKKGWLVEEMLYLSYTNRTYNYVEY